MSRNISTTEGLRAIVPDILRGRQLLVRGCVLAMETTWQCACYGDDWAVCLLWRRLGRLFAMGTIGQCACYGDDWAVCLLWGRLGSVLAMGTIGQCGCYGDDWAVWLLWGRLGLVVAMGTIGLCGCYGDDWAVWLLWGRLGCVVAMGTIWLCGCYRDAGICCNRYASNMQVCPDYRYLSLRCCNFSKYRIHQSRAKLVVDAVDA